MRIFSREGSRISRIGLIRLIRPIGLMGVALATSALANEQQIKTPEIFSASEQQVLIAGFGNTGVQKFTPIYFDGDFQQTASVGTWETSTWDASILKGSVASIYVSDSQAPVTLLLDIFFLENYSGVFDLLILSSEGNGWGYTATFDDISGSTEAQFMRKVSLDVGTADGRAITLIAITADDHGKFTLHSLHAVPEPTVWVLLGVSLLMVTILRRKNVS